MVPKLCNCQVRSLRYLPKVQVILDAGTVEFLIFHDENYYFMEVMKMQTLILTEMAGRVTGIIAQKGDPLQPGCKILKIDKDQ